MKMIIRLFICTVVLGCSFANAEQVTFNITSRVDYIDDPSGTLNSYAMPGDIITGTYTIDTNTPNTSYGSEYGHYEHALNGSGNGFKINAGSLTLKTSQSTSNFMVDISASPGWSGYSVISFGGGETNHSAIQVNDIYMDLYDPSGTANTSNALTATAPNLNNFTDRRLEMYGTNGPNYWSMQTTVTSIDLASGEGQPAPSNVTAFNITANVDYVWDDQGLMNVSAGDVITGSYSMDNTAPESQFSKGDPQFAEYRHGPSSAGFDLTVANHQIKTNVNGVIDHLTAIFNGTSGMSDHLDFMTWGNNISLGNGATVNGISMSFYDPYGNAINSNELLKTAPALSQWQYADIFIDGSYNTGGNFYIQAKITNIEAITSTSDAAFEIVPASATLLPDMRFDMGIILPAGKPPVTSIYANINGYPVELLGMYGMCHIGITSSQQTVLCPDFNWNLMPGEKNTLNVEVMYIDSVQPEKHSVEWNVLSPY